MAGKPTNPESEVSEEELLGEAEISEDDLLGEATAAQQPAQGPPPPAAPAMPPETRAPAKDPGFFRTVTSQLGSGFWKQGSDEALGLRERLVNGDVSGNGLRMPDGSVRFLGTEGDVYRASRDSEREVLRGGAENRPWTSLAANLAGDVASDFVLSRLGVPVTSTAYQTASGALSGLLGSDAELSTDNVRGGDILSAGASTALGGVLGYALPKVGAAVSEKLTPALAARMRQWLEDSAIKQGRRVLLNGADSLAGNKELAPGAVREALTSGAIKPFGTTQSAYENLEELAEMRGVNYGSILERLQASGVQGPNVEALANFFEREAADRWANSGANKSVSKVFADEAANVRAVAPPAPGSFSLVGEGPLAVPGPRLPSAPTPGARPGRDPRGRYLPKGEPRAPLPATPASPLDAPPVAPPALPLTTPVQGPMVENLPLDQAERIKRVLQGEARWDRLRMTGLDEAKQEVSSTYRKAIEDAISEAGERAPSGSEVAELASEFLPVKQQLSNTIAARDAAERGTAAAAKRRGISLTDYLSAGAAAGAGPAGQLLAAAGNNFARNRLTSAVAAGAFGASQSLGRLVNPQNAQRLGSEVGATIGRQVKLGSEGGQQEAPGSEEYRKYVVSNPQAFGAYAQRLSDAAARGPEAFAMEDYMLAQSTPEYADMRRRALMEANGETP